MNKKYELILFDLDGTLFDYEKAEGYALKKSMERFDIDYKFPFYLEKYRIINREVWREFERGETSLDELKLKRFKILFNELGINQDIKDFSNSYLNYISDTSFVTEGAEEIVFSLYGKYKLALVTNGIYSAQYERLKRSPLKNYFDVFVVSEKIGVAKPNPDFFSYVFKITEHSDKNTALIIGDSLSSDIKGGVDFGIDTCWFNPGKIRNEGDIIPTYEIEKLPQIKDILTQSHQK
ncbi:YjjG family noncanonical pyrimidine nucleotidase [candidate division WOR-3 bacterium]|nr:YjjG family noncanonical pyrimidine nucleotidase [candidate division WOR-3 bacterium]